MIVCDSFALPGDIPNHYDFVEARHVSTVSTLPGEEPPSYLARGSISNARATASVSPSGDSTADPA